MKRMSWSKNPQANKTQPIRVQKGVLINSEYEFSPPDSPKSSSFDPVPDTSHEWSDTNSDSSNSDDISKPQFSPDRIKSYKRKNPKVWSNHVNSQRRILSQGDLKFDIGSDIVSVLPCYFDKSTNTLCALYGVRGVILDINYSIVGERDIPRETKLRCSPISVTSSPKTTFDKHAIDIDNMDDVLSIAKRPSSPSLKESFQGDLSWASEMISDAKLPRNPHAIQTVVESYVILIHQSQRLTANQIYRVHSHVQNNARLPYVYDLKFESNDDGVYDRMTIKYQYVMGKYSSCIKYLKQHREIDTSEIEDEKASILAINRYLNNYSLHSGIAVHYEDTNPIDKCKGRHMKFLVLDHYCKGIFDIYYVVDPVDIPVRILALVPLTEFDVRGSYIVNNYYSFHPLNRYNYQIEPSYSDGLNKIRSIIKDLFMPIKVFSVKRSLCKNSSSLHEIYEEINPSEGEERQVIYEPQRSKIPGYKATGIKVSNYVNGLAYPERKLPTASDQYIFFDSKNYCSLDLDPFSNTFMQLLEIDNNIPHFREPCPRDILLGSTFSCDRQNFKGKENLKWFFPSEDIRILHFIVCNLGRRWDSQNPISRNSFRGEILSLYDLWIHGSSSMNPTLNSEFTQKFLRRFLWILLLEARLENDPNFHR
jgi:hypothetical protein